MVKMKKHRRGVTIHEPTYVADSAKIGRGTKIGAGCDIGKDVNIGKDCNLQAGVTISNGCKVGRNVFMAPGVHLLNDRYPPSGIRDPARIMNDVVLEGGVIIGPGVTVGSNSVIRQGANVTEDVPYSEVWSGNPAVFELNEETYSKKKMDYKHKKGGVK